MRICISTQNPSWGGGVWTQSEFLINFLENNSHEPTLLFPSNPIRNLFFQDRKVEIRSGYITRKSFNPISYANYLTFSFLVRKILRGFDIYQSIGGPNFEATPFMVAKKKYICWVGTTFRDEWKWVYEKTLSRGISPFVLSQINNISLPLLRRLEKKIFKNATFICPVSSYTASRIVHENEIDNNKIVVINNPVDTKRFKPEGQKLSAGRFILNVSRLDKRKDIPTLLRAFVKVSENHPDIKLLIVGEGPEKHNLMKLAHGLGISNRVKFCGFVDEKELPKYYRSAEIFALSSLQEGFGIVVAEAMACGTPVVSTSCGGVEDMIKDGKTGLLVKPGNDISLADNILEILESKTLKNRIGRRGMRFVRSRFSHDKIGKKFLDLYNRL